MVSGIYSIVSPSGGLYIGSSQDLDKRWYQHKYRLNKGDHHNRHLQNAWNKYKGELEFHTLLICEPINLITYEQQYLDFYQPRYNISKNADKTFNALGVKRSEETKDKLRQAHLGKPKKGHPQTERVKQLISERMVGNQIWLGRKHSEESVKKMSESQTGITRKGTPLSEKQKKFLSDSRKGSNNPMFGKIPWNKKCPT